MDRRRVVITGANRGLGLQLTRCLVERGDRVWATCRRPEAAPQVTALDVQGVVVLDLGDESSIGAAAHTVGEQVDGIDLLINCAGLDSRAFGAGHDQRGPFDLGADVFTEVLRINVTGPMVVTREFAALLTGNGPATVVNISSQLGSMEVAATMGDDAAYGVSKAALNLYTVKAAAALADSEVTVVALHPGWLRTDMGGSDAPMSVEESAAAIVSTLDHLTHADTGRFIRWDGTNHPW